ncbi:MAG: hypothetical protein ABSC05_27200 [Candidatus Solibacter sp.]|jgi:hypothetical protein
MKVCSIFSQVLKLFSRGDFEEAVKEDKAERHGHSLQGLIGVGAVMERILATGITFSEDSWQAISEQSLVFQLMEDSGAEAYALGFELLKRVKE